MPAGVIDRAQDATGYPGTSRAQTDRAALFRNLEILDSLGCLGRVLQVRFGVFRGISGYFGIFRDISGYFGIFR